MVTGQGHRRRHAARRLQPPGRPGARRPARLHDDVFSREVVQERVESARLHEVGARGRAAGSAARAPLRVQPRRSDHRDCLTSASTRSTSAIRAAPTSIPEPGLTLALQSWRHRPGGRERRRQVTTLTKLLIGLLRPYVRSRQRRGARRVEDDGRRHGQDGRLHLPEPRRPALRAHREGRGDVRPARAQTICRPTWCQRRRRRDQSLRTRGPGGRASPRPRPVRAQVGRHRIRAGQRAQRRGARRADARPGLPVAAAAPVASSPGSARRARRCSW